LIDRFCFDLQNCWNILHKFEHIKNNPDLLVLVAKFKILHWQSNRVQRFFIIPLFNSWNKLRSNLVKHFTRGEDFWMIPLNLNADFFADTNELIEKELLAERILGNQLKRDQLDFMYKTVDYIYKSHAKEKLLNKEAGIVEHTIPRLIIFNYLDNIVRINAEKKAALLKEKAKADLLLANTSVLRNEEEKTIGSDGKMGISLSKTFKEENKEEKKFDPSLTGSSLKKKHY